MIASELLERLRRHYINPAEEFPGGVFLPEVALGKRRADALYVGFTAASGQHLIGHEVKVSRADWLHELAQPTKADEWFKHCHRWMLVVPDKTIVHADELPHGWGLMVPSTRSRTRMEIVFKPVIREHIEPGWDAVQAILKKIDTGRADDRRRADREAYERYHKKLAKDTEEAVERQVRHHKERAAQAQELLAEVEKAIGLRPAVARGYDPGAERIGVDEISESVAAYFRADRDAQRALNLRYNGIRLAAEKLTAAVEALDAVQAVTE